MANQNNINPESMLRTGTVLRGTYRIDGYLSSGGFGNTYLATHVNFNEKYAIKEFFMKGVTQREGNTTEVSVSNSENVDEFNHQLEKFKKEARRLRTLNNDHIVRVHDLFDDNGTAYYVMDYIDGEDLRKRLARTNTPLSESEVTDILNQTLDALRAVHSQGIWHLDLKPANIMVDSTGTIKLIDFGASKQFDTQQGCVTSSAVAFTNGYAPYEQMEKSSDKFGPWTDFYALGATIYNLLTNKKPPMPSDINDDLTSDKHQSLPMPASVSYKMRYLILWMMRPNRTDRPKSVDEIVGSLINLESAKMESRSDSEEETRVGKKPEATYANTQQPYDEKKSEVKKPTATRIPEKKSKHTWLYFFIALILALCAAGIYAFQKYDTGILKAEQLAAGHTRVMNERMTIPKGKCHYTGEVNQDYVPDGPGTARFNNGDVCDGTFVNGNISGDNINYKFSNGDIFFGSMKNNDFKKGRYTYKSNGEYYEGTFRKKSNGSIDYKDGIAYHKNGKPICRYVNGVEKEL